MVQLIKMKTTIELLDLYISDNIASIFKDVRQNYLQQQKYVREHDMVGNAIRDSSAGAPPKKRSHQWRWFSIMPFNPMSLSVTEPTAIKPR